MAWLVMSKHECSLIHNTYFLSIWKRKDKSGNDLQKTETVDPTLSIQPILMSYFSLRSDFLIIKLAVDCSPS